MRFKLTLLLIMLFAVVAGWMTAGVDENNKRELASLQQDEQNKLGENKKRAIEVGQVAKLAGKKLPQQANKKDSTSTNQSNEPIETPYSATGEIEIAGLWTESDAAQKFWQDRVKEDPRVQVAYVNFDGSALAELSVGDKFPVKLPFTQGEYTAEVVSKRKYANGAVSIKSNLVGLERGFSSRMTLEGGNGYAHFATPEGLLNLEINSGFARAVTQRSLDMAYPEALMGHNTSGHEDTQKHLMETQEESTQHPSEPLIEFH